jgi:hypothetical protein
MAKKMGMTNTLKKQIPFHVLNGISLILATILLVASYLNMVAPISRETAMYWLFPISLAIVAEFMVFAGAWKTGAVCAVVAGIANFPLGIPSIIAGLRLHRLSRRLEQGNSVKQCLRCGYDLRGSETNVCPECGCLYGFTIPIEGLGLSKEELMK